MEKGKLIGVLKLIYFLLKLLSDGKLVNFTPKKKKKNDIGIALLLKKYNPDDVALEIYQYIYIYMESIVVYFLRFLYIE